MSFVNFGVALLLAVIGIAIKYGRASWLIAGYNTSSKDEKEKYDEAGMCKFVGNLMFALAAINAFIGIAVLLNSDYIFLIQTIGWVLFIVVTIAAVIYMNTGNRFRK